MRLFIYEECENILEDLCKNCSTTPTKYLNTLLKILRDDCHNELTEEVNERVKRVINGTKRFS